MKEYYKFKVLFMFCDLLQEKERYEQYALNNIYGFSEFSNNLSKMYKKDSKLLSDFKEVLDKLYE